MKLIKQKPSRNAPYHIWILEQKSPAGQLLRYTMKISDYLIDGSVNEYAARRILADDVRRAREELRALIARG